MNVLVTGGLGFIGSNFIRYMFSQHSDYRIINLDKVGLGANKNSLKDVENNERYRFIKGSLTNRRLVSSLVKDVDIIINFAAETHVDRSIANPKPFFLSNTLGVFTILEALREHNSKAPFIQISTDETYGDIREGSFNEESRLKPSNPYSASKAAADMFILAYHKTYNLNTFISRPTNNFGPYQFPEKLIPKTIIRASKNLPIPIYGKGTNIRDWLYVIDTCKAIELIMHKGEPGEIYNISAGNEYSNIEVVKKILKAMDKPETLITFVEDRPGHDVRYSLDSTKIRKLGWRPQYGFEEALKDTVKWYMENEWWWKPLASKKILSPTPWRLRW
ncbi:MAG: dTDP-glucose 4,6-dehydratase [Thermoproteota archaeon]